jgi:hypothetical protein
VNDVTSPWQADWYNLHIAHSASCTSIFVISRISEVQCRGHCIPALS